MKKMLMYVIFVMILCSLVLVLPAASAENGKIVYRNGDLIFIMNADGSGQTLVYEGPSLDHQPACSPDGERIAFTSNYRPGHWQEWGLYVMNVDGSGQTSLTDDPYYWGESPSWTPDGTKIAYDGGGIMGGGIYLVRPDGTDRTFLTSLAPLGDGISWSPDGTKYAFTDNNKQINVINADGTDRISLTNNAYFNSNPDWSPDGTKIVFGSYRGQGSDLYTMNSADGSDETRLTFTDNYAGLPDWSPDGTKIVFELEELDGSLKIYVMNADGSDQTRLTNDYWDREPSWCPAPGSLEVKSSPAKAKIYINGIYTEQVTRWKFDDMAPGDYEVYVILDGYSTPPTETVKVISGQTASLHFKLDKVKKVK